MGLRDLFKVQGRSYTLSPKRLSGALRFTEGFDSCLQGFQRSEDPGLPPGTPNPT